MSKIDGGSVPLHYVKFPEKEVTINFDGAKGCRATRLVLFLIFLATSLTIQVAFNIKLSTKVMRLEDRLAQVDDWCMNGRINNTETNKNLERNFSLSEFRMDASSYRIKRNIKRRRRRELNYACHLVGTTIGTQRRHFSWTKQNPNSFCEMQTIEDEPVRRGPIRNIRITQNGYYYVYAQATFFSPGNLNIGFETIMRDPQAGNRESSLLVTTAMQRSASVDQRYKDSEHHSGVFYLLAGQVLEVRPIHSTASMFDMQPNYSYFGAIYLYNK